MKYVIRCLLLALLTTFWSVAQTPMRSNVLREAAKRAGVVPLLDIQVATDPDVAAVGEKLFESTLLSFNGDTSCQTCHLDKFSSADGLPNAIGTGGHGEGSERLNGPGDIVPRNTLALWGRGTIGFNTFFWDGKVSFQEDAITSQFGDQPPSDDPLVVAVHLPFVEIREMVVRDKGVREEYEQESVDAALEIYEELVSRIKQDESLAEELSLAFGITVKELKFLHIAEAVATFIRYKFSVTETKFNTFMFLEGSLSEEEVAGGLLFYGKARCSTCHSGPLLSDLDFHVMPFEQAGFGKNGFGIDYGRFNATRDPNDTYYFRTPPLINVLHTAPYSHSGSIAKLEDMIRVHVDPLANYDGRTKTPIQRREDLTRLRLWVGDSTPAEPLIDSEISAIAAFLATQSTP